MITKTQALASLQCVRHAWLAVHDPTRATALSASRQALRDAGREIGRLAYALFPGAVLVDEPDFTRACARTEEILAGIEDIERTGGKELSEFIHELE